MNDYKREVLRMLKDGCLGKQFNKKLINDFEEEHYRDLKENKEKYLAFVDITDIKGKILEVEILNKKSLDIWLKIRKLKEKKSIFRNKEILNLNNEIYKIISYEKALILEIIEINNEIIKCCNGYNLADILQQRFVMSSKDESNYFVIRSTLDDNLHKINFEPEREKLILRIIKCNTIIEIDYIINYIQNK